MLRRGGDLLGAERAEIVERRQRRAAQLLADQAPGAAPADLFRGSPDRYFAENSAARVAAHMRLLAQRRQAGTASAGGRGLPPESGSEVTEMVLAARDTPGLLAHVAGVLHANRITIVDAAIYSRVSTPEQAAEALDIFRLRDSYGRLVTDEGSWAKIRDDLEAVLSGPGQGRDPGGGPAPGRHSITVWKVPEVPLEIKVDNQGSRKFTIVEVITGDYPGVLYTIARTLFDQGLDIHRSKIATEANRVVDTFYVRERGGQKVTDGDGRGGVARRPQGFAAERRRRYQARGACAGGGDEIARLSPLPAMSTLLLLTILAPPALRGPGSGQGQRRRPVAGEGFVPVQAG